jgi:hypothetical protein
MDGIRLVSGLIAEREERPVLWDPGSFRDSGGVRAVDRRLTIFVPAMVAIAHVGMALVIIRRLKRRAHVLCSK